LYLIKQLRSAKAKTPRRLLPPGPPGLPLLGNLLDWPTSDQWVTLSNWAEVYGGCGNGLSGMHRYNTSSGDIIYANVLGTNMVVLNSVKVATDLLSQKGAIYSDRARFHFVAKLVGWEHDNVFMDLGPDLKESRRLVMQELGPRGKLKELSHTTESETKMFLGRLLDNPSSDAIYDHIRRYAI
jgi:cytochrome P450